MDDWLGCWITDNHIYQTPGVSQAAIIADRAPIVQLPAISGTVIPANNGPAISAVLLGIHINVNRHVPRSLGLEMQLSNPDA